MQKIVIFWGWLASLIFISMTNAKVDEPCSNLNYLEPNLFLGSIQTYRRPSYPVEIYSFLESLRQRRPNTVEDCRLKYREAICLASQTSEDQVRSNLIDLAALLLKREKILQRNLELKAKLEQRNRKPNGLFEKLKKMSRNFFINLFKF